MGREIFSYLNDVDVDELTNVKRLLGHHLDNMSSSALIGKLYLNQGQIYRKIKNYPLAQKTWKKAISYFKLFDDPLNLARAYYYQGLTFKEEEKFSEALSRWNNILELSVLDDEPELKSKAFYQMGITLIYHLQDLEKARRYLEEGAGLAKKAGDYHLEIKITQELACLLVKMGDFDQALRVYYRVIARWKGLNEKSQLAKVLDDLGRLHQKMDQVKRAISAFKYSLRLKEKCDRDNIGATIIQLSKTYLEDDIEKTRYYCQKFTENFIEDVDYIIDKKVEKELAQIFFLMGLYCQRKDDKKNMLIFFKQSLTIYKKYEMEDKWHKVYKIYSKYNKSENKFSETKDLVNGLANHEKLRLHKSMGIG